MTQEQENLIAGYFLDQLTEEEKSQLLSLLDTDEECRIRFAQMQKAYAAAALPAFERTRSEDFRRLERSMRPARILSFWKPVAIAASLSAILALGAALYSGSRFRAAERFLSQTETTTIAATRGTGTETVLPDGTRACLNAGSTLSFGRGFGRGSRDVILEGEGYFEVTKDAANPFRVHAGEACVTVKGTIFNVRSYADEPDIAVSLLEGSVLLTASSGEVMLKPGHCGVVSRESGRIRVEKADMAVSDWTLGKIVFTDKSIPEILHYIERVHGVSFVYDKALFRGERFTGKISSGLSIDEILTYIDIDHKYKWTRKEDIIEIQQK